MFYKLALQSNENRFDYYHDVHEQHGKSVILLGKFSEKNRDEALEVARLVFGVHQDYGVKVKILDERSRKSVYWTGDNLCEFTERWFSVMCGPVDEPLEKSDLGTLGRRFWNSMVSINGQEYWTAHENRKAEQFWPWLAARTFKIYLRDEMSNVSKARTEDYPQLFDQWCNCKIPRRYEDDTNFHRGSDREIYKELKSRAKRYGIEKKEENLSQSKSDFSSLVTKLLRDGDAGLERKRRIMLSKARIAMREAVFDANAGDGYSDCLKLADRQLQLNGTSREVWLGMLLFELPPTRELLFSSRPYLHPTPSELKKGDRQAQKALDELDKNRKEFIATISPKTHTSPSGWRYELYERLDDQLKNEPEKRKERRALKEKWKKAELDYGTLESCLIVCDRLLPRSNTGRERSPEISQTRSPSRGRSNETRDSSSKTVPSSRKPTSSNTNSSKPNPVPALKQRAQDVTVSSSSKPAPPARQYSQNSQNEDFSDSSVSEASTKKKRGIKKIMKLSRKSSSGRKSEDRQPLLK